MPWLALEGLGGCGELGAQRKAFALRCQERRAIQGTIRVASTRGTIHARTPLFR